MIVKELERRGIDYVLINGSYEEREAKAIATINEKLKTT